VPQRSNEDFFALKGMLILNLNLLGFIQNFEF
jgi:hypothetical protein